VPSKCNVFHYFSSYSFIGHYMFRPNWPFSGSLDVVVKDSATHYNAVFFPPIEVASGYFWLCGFHVVSFGFTVSRRILNQTSVHLKMAS
jgi:hypothetical protein